MINKVYRLLVNAFVMSRTRPIQRLGTPDRHRQPSPDALVLSSCLIHSAAFTLIAKLLLISLNRMLSFTLSLVYIDPNQMGLQREKIVILLRWACLS